METTDRIILEKYPADTFFARMPPHRQVFDAAAALWAREAPAAALVCSSSRPALHQLPQQIRRHRQLGKRKATSSDLVDRTADTGRFRMGRDPTLGGLLAGLAGWQHIRDQSSFSGCDLVEGAVDSETLEIIVRRHAARGGDDAVETEIGLGGE